MKNFKEFMEDVDSDESPIETRATTAKASKKKQLRTRASSMKRKGQCSMAPTS